MIGYFVRLQSRLERATGTIFPGSRTYWDRRYASGGNSGAGSYGHLAQFKADYLNDFVLKNAAMKVIEFGCGDGNQLSIANYPSYYGVDVSKRAVDFCRRRFQGDASKRFGFAAPAGESFDLALSLDVIYHLIEDDVFEKYMISLFAASERWVIIYSSNTTQVEFEKRYPGQRAQHVKHRKFADWIDAHVSDWRLIAHDQNPYQFDPSHAPETSFADFYVYGRI